MWRKVIPIFLLVTSCISPDILKVSYILVTVQQDEPTPENIPYVLIIDYRMDLPHLLDSSSLPYLSVMLVDSSYMVEIPYSSKPVYISVFSPQKDTVIEVHGDSSQVFNLEISNLIYSPIYDTTPPKFVGYLSSEKVILFSENIVDSSIGDTKAFCTIHRLSGDIDTILRTWKEDTMSLNPLLTGLKLVPPKKGSVIVKVIYIDSTVCDLSGNKIGEPIIFVP